MQLSILTNQSLTFSLSYSNTLIDVPPLNLTYCQPIPDSNVFPRHLYQKRLMTKYVPYPISKVDIGTDFNHSSVIETIQKTKKQNSARASLLSGKSQSICESKEQKKSNGKWGVTRRKSTYENRTADYIRAIVELEEEEKQNERREMERGREGKERVVYGYHQPSQREKTEGREGRGKEANKSFNSGVSTARTQSTQKGKEIRQKPMRFR